MNNKSSIKSALFLSCVLVAAVAPSVSCGSGGGGGTLDKVKREKRLKIATHPVNEPFEFGSGTEVDGFDVDLCNAIARELGAETRWIKREFDECFEFLKSGDADIVINAVTITPEREKDYLFSAPYFETGQIVAVAKDNDSVKSSDDLRGKKVGCQKNTTSEQFLQAMGKGAVNIDNQYNSPEDALGDLNRRLLDAVVGDAPTLLVNIAKNNPNCKLVGNLLTKESYGVVIRKDDKDLKAEIDKIIQKLKDSGEIAALVKKWNLDTAVLGVPAADAAPPAELK